MGVQDQISAMLNANIEDRLCRVDDPAARLNQIVHEMDVTLQRAAASIAEDLTELRRTRDAVELAQLQVTAWEKQVASARLRQDSVAECDAVAQLKVSRLDAQQYEDQLNTRMHAVAQFITQRDTLRGKYHDLQDRRDVFIACARQARIPPRTAPVPGAVPEPAVAVAVQHEIPRLQPRYSFAGAILQLVHSAVRE